MTDARVRTSIIGVVAFALFSALFARLWYLQVASADQFHAAASKNAVREIREPAPRGRILDEQGNVLVDNRVENDITIDRKVSAADRKRDLAKLSTLLGVPVKTLEVNLNDPRISPYTPVPVATDVPYEKLAWVAEHKEQLPGVRAEAVPIRRYPNNALAAHVLGYVGEINADELERQPVKGEYSLGDTIGKSGVELSYEADLRGKPGVRRVEVDATGRVIRTLSSRPPVPGHDVRLTLDLGVQQTAEAALQQGIDAARNTQDKEYKQGFRKFAAPAGAVVVLDATTGSVVAMASNPAFDPNQFVHGIPQSTWTAWQSPSSGFPLLNRAVSGQYAPGSTFKLMTSVAGLTSGELSSGKTINDKGSYVYPTDPNRKFWNDGHASYGRVDLSRALTVSSDVYFYTVGGDLYYRWKHEQPGGNALQDTARQWGFGTSTGISLPNEATGRIPDATWKQQIHAQNPAGFPYPDWLPGDNILSAVGQGDVLVTPIQLASAYATLANGGTRYSPRLADAVFDVRGHKIRDLPAIDVGHVDVPARETLLAGFTGVAEDPKGTAAQVFAGFPKGMVAGKTGTAQVEGKQSTAWFVGMTPAAQPRFIVLAMVEEGGYGAQTAAPIARAVLQQLNGIPVTPVVNIAPPSGN
jgi:penicillin-binding protein 2